MADLRWKEKEKAGKREGRKGGGDRHIEGWEGEKEGKNAVVRTELRK